MTKKFEDLPYRPCVGMMVINRTATSSSGGGSTGLSMSMTTHAWQMPQGGVDEGEDPYKAALRELYEETNIRSVEKLGEIMDWLTYDIPRDIAGQAWKGKYRGQKQKWYALRFTGDGERDRHRASGRRRAQAGIRGMALGAVEQSAGAHHPLQARCL